jgi:hypothetical protein
MFICSATAKAIGEGPKMVAAKQGENSEQAQYRNTACSPLKHPLRVRILEIVNEEDKSPIQFVNEGLVPKEAGYKSPKHALSHVAYHFRELEKAGCVRVVDTHQRRGATEHIYRGTARAYFTDEEFARLTLEERRDLSRVSFQGLIARFDGALRADTIDNRPDRHLTWIAMDVDEQGWSEMMACLADCFGEVEQIRHDAGKRLEDSGETPVPMTYGMVGFESPPSPRSALPAEIAKRRKDAELGRRTRDDYTTP